MEGGGHLSTDLILSLLEGAAGLDIGSRVRWKKNGTKGTVRHVGAVRFGAGDYIGVELDAPVGDNDGTVDGLIYFTCRPRHGVFVTPLEVEALDGGGHRSGGPWGGGMVGANGEAALMDTGRRRGVRRTNPAVAAATSSRGVGGYGASHVTVPPRGPTAATLALAAAVAATASGRPVAAAPAAPAPAIPAPLDEDGMPITPLHGQHREAHTSGRLGEVVTSLPPAAQPTTSASSGSGEASAATSSSETNGAWTALMAVPPPPVPTLPPHAPAPAASHGGRAHNTAAPVIIPPPYSRGGATVPATGLPTATPSVSTAAAATPAAPTPNAPAMASVSVATRSHASIPPSAASPARRGTMRPEAWSLHLRSAGPGTTQSQSTTLASVAVTTPARPVTAGMETGGAATKPSIRAGLPTNPAGARAAGGRGGSGGGGGGAPTRGRPVPKTSAPRGANPSAFVRARPRLPASGVPASRAGLHEVGSKISSAASLQSDASTASGDGGERAGELAPAAPIPSPGTPHHAAARAISRGRTQVASHAEPMKALAASGVAAAGGGRGQRATRAQSAPRSGAHFYATGAGSLASAPGARDARLQPIQSGRPHAALGAAARALPSYVMPPEPRRDVGRPMREGGPPSNQATVPVGSTTLKHPPSMHNPAALASPYDMDAHGRHHPDVDASPAQKDGVTDGGKEAAHTVAQVVGSGRGEGTLPPGVHADEDVVTMLIRSRIFKAPATGKRRRQATPQDGHATPNATTATGHTITALHQHAPPIVTMPVILPSDAASRPLFSPAGTQSVSLSRLAALAWGKAPAMSPAPVAGHVATPATVAHAASNAPPAPPVGEGPGAQDLVERVKQRHGAGSLLAAMSAKVYGAVPPPVDVAPAQEMAPVHPVVAPAAAAEPTPVVAEAAPIMAPLAPMPPPLPPTTASSAELVEDDHSVTSLPTHSPKVGGEIGAALPPSPTLSVTPPTTSPRAHSSPLPAPTPMAADAVTLSGPPSARLAPDSDGVVGGMANGKVEKPNRRAPPPPGTLAAGPATEPGDAAEGRGARRLPRHRHAPSAGSEGGGTSAPPPPPGMHVAAPPHPTHPPPPLPATVVQPPPPPARPTHPAPPPPAPAATAPAAPLAPATPPRTATMPMPPSAVPGDGVSGGGVEEDVCYVKSYAGLCDKGFNPGNPDKPNQDAVVMKEHAETDTVLLAVFDGHGDDGHLIATHFMDMVADLVFAHPALHEYVPVADNIPPPPPGLDTAATPPPLPPAPKTSVLPPVGPERLRRNVAAALKHALSTCEQQVLARDDIDATLSGCTGCVVAINGGSVTVANVGDSRCVLVRRMGADASSPALYLHPVTVDHKPSLSSETRRILLKGGRLQSIQYGDGVDGPVRVWLRDDDIPGLAMSRSLCDTIGKRAGVISDPDIYHYTLTPRDAYIMVASDGLWEFTPLSEIGALMTDLAAEHAAGGDGSDKEGGDARPQYVQVALEALATVAGTHWHEREGVMDDTSIVLAEVGLVPPVAPSAFMRDDDVGRA